MSFITEIVTVAEKRVAHTLTHCRKTKKNQMIMMMGELKPVRGRRINANVVCLCTENNLISCSDEL